MVSSTPRPHFIPGKDPVPILQGAGWASGPVWTSGKSSPHRDSIPDRPARSQSLYRLSYPAHIHIYSIYIYIYIYMYIYSATILSQKSRYPPIWHTRQLNFSNISSGSQAYITSEGDCHCPTQVAVSRKATGPTNHGGGAEHCVLYRKPFI